MKLWILPLLGAMVWPGTIAFAQTDGPMRVTTEIEVPPVEASAAFMMADFQKDRSEQKEFPDFGWSLSLGANFGAWVALVGEVDGYANYYTAPATNPRIGAQGAFNHVHDFLAGPRGHSRFIHVGKGRDRLDLRIFGQVLAGIRISEVESGRRAVQPGGGVDVHTKRGLTIRYAIDRCLVEGSGRGLSGSRWLIGLVFGPS